MDSAGLFVAGRRGGRVLHTGLADEIRFGGGLRWWPGGVPG
ncbi:hypothetical protein JIX56_46175 [Streptomyces sp. CA-210063]|nr:hypothetical protein [Streptomyces sp. CA-210063]UUU36614.1 hypothetical protein JIX56_46175 [Streptomyces sp. CA-210063]